VTERESWILDNLDKNAGLTVEQNAAMIEPGLEQAVDSFKKSVYDEVRHTLDAIYATHGKGQWKQKLMINDRIADSVFQQVLMRADEYSVLATSNLNGDYLSDACARRSAASAWRRARILATATACLKPRTARRRNMRIKT